MKIEKFTVNFNNVYQQFYTSKNPYMFRANILFKLRKMISMIWNTISSINICMESLSLQSGGLPINNMTLIIPFFFLLIGKINYPYNLFYLRFLTNV